MRSRHVVPVASDPGEWMERCPGGKSVRSRCPFRADSVGSGPEIAGEYLAAGGSVRIMQRKYLCAGGHLNTVQWSRFRLTEPERPAS
jgi:hypothetical protein